MPPPQSNSWRIHWSNDGGSTTTTEYQTLLEALSAVDSLVSSSQAGATQYSYYWLEEIATGAVYNKCILRMV